MSPAEREHIKTQIYNLRIDNANAQKLLDPAYWNDAFKEALEVVANGRGISIEDASQLIHELGIEQRKNTIAALYARLGEPIPKPFNLKNIVRLPARKP